MVLLGYLHWAPPPPLWLGNACKNDKDASAYRFPQTPWYIMWHCLIFRSCDLKVHASGAIIYCFFFVSVHVDLVYGVTCQQPGLLCFSFLSHSTAGIIILLPFIAMYPSLPSHLRINSMSAGLYGTHLWLMESHMVQILTSSSIVILISSVLKQSGMTIHSYCIDGDAYAWDFFISVSWLCMDSQSVITAVVQACTVQTKSGWFPTCSCQNSHANYIIMS